MVAYSTYAPDDPPLPNTSYSRRSVGGVVGTTLVLLGVVLWLRLRVGAGWVARGPLLVVLLDSMLLWIASAILPTVCCWAAARPGAEI